MCELYPVFRGCVRGCRITRPIKCSFLQLFTLPLCPESPKHLLLDRDDEGKAEANLKWLRGKVDVRGELGEMRSEFFSDFQ